MSYTVTTLEISAEAWDEVARRIRAAESPGNTYDQMFMDEKTIDMTHVAIVREDPVKTARKLASAGKPLI